MNISSSSTSLVTQLQKASKAVDCYQPVDYAFAVKILQAKQDLRGIEPSRETNDSTVTTQNYIYVRTYIKTYVEAKPHEV